MTIIVKQLHTFTGHKDSIYAMSGDSNSQTFYTGGGDGYIVAWDLQNQEDGVLFAKLETAVYTLLKPANVHYLIAGTANGIVYIFDTKNKELIRTIQTHPTAIFDMVLIGDKLYISGFDGNIVVIHIETFGIVQRIKISNKSVRKLLYQAHSNELICACSNAYIYILPLDHLDDVSRLDGHENSIFALTINELNDQLITGGRDAKIRIYNPLDKLEIKTLDAHLLHIKDLIFVPNLGIYISSSMDKTIKLWDAESDELLKVIDKPKFFAHSSSVNKLLMLTEHILLSASDDKTVMTWEISRT
ncbi:MAG: hypothetical protein HYZ42_11970 [Bacteroidetes bacterium]|nr:hypothetical protein [Bacteroidota bacterium]